MDRVESPRSVARSVAATYSDFRNYGRPKRRTPFRVQTDSEDQSLNGLMIETLSRWGNGEELLDRIKPRAAREDREDPSSSTQMQIQYTRSQRTSRPISQIRFPIQGSTGSRRETPASVPRGFFRHLHIFAQLCLTSGMRNGSMHITRHAYPSRTDGFRGSANLLCAPDRALFTTLSGANVLQVTTGHEQLHSRHLRVKLWRPAPRWYSCCLPSLRTFAPADSSRGRPVAEATARLPDLFAEG